MRRFERIKLRNGPTIDIEHIKIPLEENVQLDEWGKILQEYIKSKEYKNAIELVDHMYDIARAERQYARVLFYSAIRDGIKGLQKK